VERKNFGALSGNGDLPVSSLLAIAFSWILASTLWGMGGEAMGEDGRMRSPEDPKKFYKFRYKVRNLSYNLT
jgi:hypothetical protein